MTGERSYVRVQAGDRVAELVLDRPEVRNAIDPKFISDLGFALDELDMWARKSLCACAVVVVSSGPVFVSGADLRYLGSISTAEEMASFSRTMQATLDRLEELPVPVIAALDGPALGGGTEVALACDVRIMAEDAYFSFKYARVGVVPGWGGSRRLAQLVGYSRALLLTATAAEVPGPEAVRLGLADRLVSAGAAASEARRMAATMSTLAPLSIRELKGLLKGALVYSRTEAATRETDAFVRLWASYDHKEGLESLLQRRSPRFEGR